MHAKQAVRDLLEKLPDECTLDEIVYHLYVLHQVSDGERAADAGELIPHDQVLEELRRRWLLGDA